MGNCGIVWIKKPGKPRQAFPKSPARPLPEGSELEAPLCPASLPPLSLRHASHTKSAILSRLLLAPFQSQHGASRIPSQFRPICLSFAMVFLTLKGERPGMPLIHIPRDRAGERIQVGRHLGRVSDSSTYSKRCRAQLEYPGCSVNTMDIKSQRAPGIHTQPTLSIN